MKFDLNLFIDSHPILALIIILFVIGILCFTVYSLSFIFKRGGKIGPISIEKEEEIKDAIEEFEVDNSFLKCISSVVSYSIQSGFEKCTKRQELHNKQMGNVYTRFEGISSQIVNEYSGKKKTDPYIMKQIEIIIECVFKDVIYKTLEKIFKEDRLCEKTKEAIVEEHRHSVDSVMDNIIKKTNELIIANKDLDGLVEILKTKKDDIKRAMIDSLEIAYDLAKEEMKFLQEEENKLNEQINNTLLMYLGKKIDKSKFPSNWNDQLPPNNIIGEIK